MTCMIIFEKRMKKSSSYPEDNQPKRRSTTSQQRSQQQRKRNSTITTSTTTASAAAAAAAVGRSTPPQQQQRHPIGLLPPDFSPGPMDVICAVGHDAKTHEGNIRFRNFVDHISTQYGQTTSKLEKTRIVDSVIGYVRNYGGGFVKYDSSNKRWHDVGGIIAREKVGQCLRANNHTQYKSSTKTKRKLRKQINDRLGDKVATIMSNNATVASEIQRLQNTITSQFPSQQQQSPSQQQQQQQPFNYPSYSSSSSPQGTVPVPQTQLPVRSASAPVVPSSAAAPSPSPSPVMALDDSALELAMTNANIRILASLKSDLTFQSSMRNMNLNDQSSKSRVDDDDDDDDDDDEEEEEEQIGNNDQHQSASSSASKKDDDNDDNMKEV